MQPIKTHTLILGGGPAGYAAAIRLGQLGKDCTLVEKKRVGGTCLNVGCIPSKALLHATNTYHSLQVSAPKMGLEFGAAPTMNWPKTMAWKDKLVNQIVGGVEFLLKRNKVRVINGFGKLKSNQQVEVEGQALITAEHILLATGSKVIALAGFEVDHQTVLDSTDLLSLKSVPKSMIMLGGGIIGTELSTVYANLGCKVQIVEMADRILLNYEEPAVRIVQNALKQLGVEVFTGAKATKMQVTPATKSAPTNQAKKTAVKLWYQDKNGAKHTLTAEKLVVAVGRQPELHGVLNGLALEQNRGRLVVNDQFQTSLPEIYAVGDLIDGPMLAHKATAEGIMCAERIAGHKISRQDLGLIPDVVYTHPEIASVGLSVEQATAKGIHCKVSKFPFSALGRAQTAMQTNGYVKLIANQENDQLIGGTIVAERASDLISELALGISLGSKAADMEWTIHPHPSFSEALMESAAGLNQRAIHMINS